MREKNHTLRDLLRKHTHKQVFTGWSGAEAYYLPGLAAYLKIAPTESPSNLAREKEVLEWLEEKLPVPKVLGFQEAEGKQLILLSEIKGLAASEHVAANRHDTAAIFDFIKKAAEALRSIHDLPVNDCPLAQDIEVKLSTARENIRRGFVVESDFDRENQGRNAREIYDELVGKKPLSEDLVFTHGDFCLPNFMILDGEISGFIDLDRAGIADRCQDIALFLRSFAFNIETPVDVREIFCSAYGIEAIDEEKIYYYRLLDELF
jgi:aminoglycoside phosphotransferase